jgi:glycerophosphoryl diester phosphodiesterase
MNRRPIVIAHRGACGYLPEHCLAAKALAFGQGADYLEQDVVLTRDGVPIVVHDVHLDEVSDVALRYPGRARADGRFYALDFVLEEVRRLRLHERCSPRREPVFPDRFPAGVDLPLQIPTLREELDFIAGLERSSGRRIGVYTEIKQPDFHREAGWDIAAIVAECLADCGRSGPDDRVFLQCFDSATLTRLRRDLGVGMPLVQLLPDRGWPGSCSGEAGLDGLMAEIRRYADAIGPAWDLLAAEVAGGYRLTGLIGAARRHGLAVHAYTFRRDQLPSYARSFEHWLSIAFEEAGLDGIFCDFPDLAVNWLRRRGVHASARSSRG